MLSLICPAALLPLVMKWNLKRDVGAPDVRLHFDLFFNLLLNFIYYLNKRVFLIPTYIVHGRREMETSEANVPVLKRKKIQ